jgi:hypothetical protein
LADGLHVAIGLLLEYKQSLHPIFVYTSTCLQKPKLGCSLEGVTLAVFVLGVVNSKKTKCATSCMQDIINICTDEAEELGHSAVSKKALRKREV